MRHTLRLAAAALLTLTPAGLAQNPGDPNALVDSWYRAFLGRPADAGSAFWVTDLQQNVGPDAVLAGILGSDEYYARHGNTPAGFVGGLFADLLHRPANPNDLNIWVGRLYTADRQEVALEIMTQNPGNWVGPAPAQPNVNVVVAPPNVRWERDRHEDWLHHHGIYDYRRPPYPYGR